MKPNDRPLAILLTCYMTGSTQGRNLGTAGYSYDFVTALFNPILARWGEVIPVPEPALNLESAAADARARGLEPIHISFLPFQDVHLSPSTPNVVVPAWEFPDVPDHPFGFNSHNDWPAVANQCDQIVVGGPFTRETFQRGGMTVPIHIVPVPIPPMYFEIDPWQSTQTHVLDCDAYVIARDDPQFVGIGPTAPLGNPVKRTGKAIERTVRRTFKRIFGPNVYRRVSRPIESAWDRIRSLQRRSGAKEKPIVLPYEKTTELELSGVVYTSIFNPDDGRKNWTDLVTGFLCAMADHDDATLVVKLITRSATSVEKFVEYIRRRDIPRKCKVVVICDFLSDAQMRNLAAASTYYYQTTKAEGNCLPLMNYLAAGRPGVSPNHSAIGDYFGEDEGFVVASHPEPAAWPHDMRLRLRTSWGRIVWPSIEQQIRASYALAKHDARGYAELAERSRSKMKHWASYDAVSQCMDTVMAELTGRTEPGESQNTISTHAALREAA